MEKLVYIKESLLMFLGLETNIKKPIEMLWSN